MSSTLLTGVYVALAAGAAGLYLCLPSTRHDAERLRKAGALFATAGLVTLSVHLARWIGAAFEGRTFFIIFAALAIAAAVRVVTHPKPVYNALYFVLVVLAVSGLCVLAAAEFLAIALVIVYAGAILVTYVFVIMLAQQRGVAPYDYRAREPFAAVVMGFVLVAATTHAMTERDPIAQHAAAAHHGYRIVASERAIMNEPPAPETGKTIDPAAINGDVGNVRALGETLMTTFVVAVEVAGLLLLVAMVGAIAIAQKRIEPSALTEAERRETTADEDVHRRGREAVPY